MHSSEKVSNLQQASNVTITNETLTSTEEFPTLKKCITKKEEERMETNIRRNKK